jgi:hypothetical protein
MSKIPHIEVPAIHPRQRQKRGAAQAENARLTKALMRIEELADLPARPGESLAAIKYVVATALQGETP